MKPFYFNIDVLGAGACNLRCPSCPVGNSDDIINPKGLMEPELLNRILQKAKSECDVVGVSLFNWTEPLLHPRLPELVDVVHSHGVRCDLSSNLNMIRNIDEVLRRNPENFRISNSGFTQEIYCVTHRGGDIEQVKRNMGLLAESHKRVNSTTRIHLLYHRYQANLDDELLMKQYCESLGFGFEPVLAFMMPLEKVIAHIEKDPDMAAITSEDSDVMGRLLLPIDEALEAARAYRGRDCDFRSAEMTLDFRGHVQLCCATYDSTRFTIGNYLEVPLADLQSARYKNRTCGRCMKHGIHIYYTYAAPEFNAIAARHSAPRHQAQLAALPSRAKVEVNPDAAEATGPTPVSRVQSGISSLLKRLR